MSDLGDMLVEAMGEARDHARGKKAGARETVVVVEVPDEIDVAAIRHGLNMSRPVFAAHFGFKLRTLEKWEQRAREPDGAARAYLTVIARDPEAVIRALAAKSPKAA